jgi:hypothetical protein
MDSMNCILCSMELKPQLAGIESAYSMASDMYFLNAVTKSIYTRVLMKMG